jgi:hypothetical protein
VHTSRTPQVTPLHYATNSARCTVSDQVPSTGRRHHHSFDIHFSTVNVLHSRARNRARNGMSPSTNLRHLLYHPYLLYLSIHLHYELKSKIFQQEKNITASSFPVRRETATEHKRIHYTITLGFVTLLPHRKFIKHSTQFQNSPGPKRQFTRGHLCKTNERPTAPSGGIHRPSAFQPPDALLEDRERGATTRAR